MVINELYSENNMKKSIIWCTFLLLSAACTTELTEENPSLGRKTLNVSLDPSTRIQLDDNQQTVWNKGDLLSVYDYSEANECWEFIGETGSRSGIIQSDGTANEGTPIDKVIIAYPYRTDYVLSSSDNTLSTTFPATQTYLKGSYGIGENVMIAAGTGQNLMLRNVFGWLKIQLTGSASVRSIALRGNDNEQLTGSIGIDYETLEVNFNGDDSEGAASANETIILDCGKEGVELNSSTATSFYIALVPCTFRNGFTIRITGTDGTTLEKSTANEVVVGRNVIKPFRELQFGNIETVGGTNLSSSGTANCYVVSKAGDYKFYTVQGNSSTSVGAVASAEVLWETFGTNVAPNKGSLIAKVSYKDRRISFSTAGLFHEGNAVIAAKDAAGNILWSWHIWMTDKPQNQVYKNNAGIMMDRNLGATSVTSGDVGALGLFYQWGRKDPFLGSSSISGNIKAKSTLNSWPTATSSASNGTIAYATSHPTTFICHNSSNYDWYYTGNSSTDNTRWQSTKTIYDPCPVGYRVPDGGNNGVWATAFGTNDSFDEDGFDSTNKGFNFGKNDLTSYLTEEAACWYPAAGYLSNDEGSLSTVGRSGSYWSCSSFEYYAYYLSFGYLGSVYPSGNFQRVLGHSVRCLKE